MKSLLCVTALLLAAVSAHRETIDEAAIHTRELIAYRAYNLGVLASTYPASAGDLAGLVIPLQEYYAHYPDGSGDLLFLAMPIARVFANALPPNPPNMTITISDLAGLGDGDLAAGRMRVALFGSLERVTGEEEAQKCREAYLAAHPDARGWVPPYGPHSGFYARLRINKVYAFDGFGNVAYIGWIPLDMYRAAGDLIRSEKEVLRDWPVPEQPEPEDELARDMLFAESTLGGETRFQVQI